MKLNESEYEKTIIKYTQDVGFKYVPFDELFPMRGANTLEIILEDELIAFLNSNNNLSSDMISDVVRKIKDLKGGDYIKGNFQFQKYISEGVKVFDKKKQKYVTVKLFKKKSNRLIVTNQFIMKSSHPDYENQKPDVVLYMNGLPISVIELKNPTNESNDTLEKAYQQIENYKEYLPYLFIYNLFNIISDGNISKVGSLTSTFSRYQNWRGSKFDSPESTLFKDLLKENVLIDFIKNFSFYLSESDLSKVIAGYHQFYGVKAAVKSVNNAISGNKKGGIFWHTQGSGKSFSMLFFIKNITKLHPGTTFIIVTDRNSLDTQLSKTFNSARDFLGQKVKQISSIKNLKSELMGKKQDGVYLTTVQKFTEDVGRLINRENVVIISDEAHRSHNNIEGRYEIDVNTQTYSKKFGNAKYLRDAFPKATFIGFTGTPIENEDKSTTSIFGGVVSEYKMSDAERDGVIVPINYESRKAKLILDEKLLNELDVEDQEINRKLNNVSILPGEVKKKLNKSIKKLNNFVSDKDRIRGIAQDFVNHYESRQNIVKGKAMFVALNRHVALKYYKEIIKIRSEWKSKIKLIVTVNKQNDLPELIKIAESNFNKKKVADDFKNPDSNFKIAIVVDMWLTGFDVPSLDTLYLDKPAKMHNLMQTIARTNRVYNNKKEGIVKVSGLVVDYIGIFKKLADALTFYSGSKSKNLIIKTHDLNSLKKEYLKILKMLWENFNISKLEIDISKALLDGSYAFSIIDTISNLILKKGVQNKFVDTTKVLSKYVKNVISILTSKERMQFQILISARLRLIKLAMDDFDFSETKKMMLEKLEDTIKYEKTVVIDKVNNTKIRISDILKFVETETNENEELNAREKAAAIKLMCKHLAKINIIRAGKLSSDINKLMNQYESSYISLEELKKGLIFINYELKGSFNNQEKDGFTQEEKTFYDILLEPIKQTDFDKEKIKIILSDLLKIVNDDKLVNKQWIFNQLLIKKTRANLKVLLKKHAYPPQKVDITKKNIIDQIMQMKGIN